MTSSPTTADPAQLGSQPRFAGLREQLGTAAEAFSADASQLGQILTGLVDDVDRALAEPLEIFPVCHHSPASGLAMVRRLAAKQPQVIYLELCDDLRPLLDELCNCRLPVALQAFASEISGFPKESAPLSVVAPITEASAEYQAIAYALQRPGEVELVLVDRSADHVFQWLPDPTPPDPDDDSPPATEALEQNDPEAQEEGIALHGEAVGIEIGDLRPRFAQLEEHLLHHGKVRHWSEWWDQYVEQPLSGADHETYRQVMVLIGSLFRRLTPADDPRLAMDCDRERYMWTRIREHLASSGADPARCVYVCGAFHAASRVEQFGLHPENPVFDISPRTATKWLYGMIPSSHSAIEAQFGLASGSVSIAAATWSKALKRYGIVPFRFKAQQPTKAAKTPKTPLPVPVTAHPATPAEDRLSGFLAQPPRLDQLDEAELLEWCVEIVRLARRNGYLSSTADAIAVFETSLLLAAMRNRSRPTPYDFADAAVTCIEKEAVPGRRDVRRLCEILLGGDRIGQVGYNSLPTLARDVIDRLAPLKLNPRSSTIQRCLMDLRQDPELVPCSNLLWVLQRLLPSGVVRPIMGQRRLGEQPIQESWDLALGRDQRAVIELGYEGVTVEQVLERRLRKQVHAKEATPAVALAAVEDAILYLGGSRFSGELGTRAVHLLSTERTVDDAPEVLRRVRRLLAHFRATEPNLPSWCEAFATTGYAQYCTLLPGAFTDENTTIRQLGAMLGFLFGMETLAISLGCERTQLELAVAQSHPQDPAKLALLWAAQLQLGLITLEQLRERCDELLANPLVVPAFPRYLSGFVQALEAAPTMAGLVVELISKAFARLPDPVLLPWLPTLITTLRDDAAELVPVLVREAGRIFPAGLAAVDALVPPWEQPTRTPRAPRNEGEGKPGASGPVSELLARYPVTAQAVTALLAGQRQ